uniref:G-protein coupled receptors family 1 profile domain-containing protein n=1 Tax=Anopheles culicifacies TaxID=139723 RepID=A0A182MX65_9DIPT
MHRILITANSFLVLSGCLIVSIPTASFITQGLTQLCAEFQKVNTVQGLSCARLIVYFSLVEENTTLVQEDKNFLLTLVFSWIWCGATIFGFCVILLRIILMADFELYRVVVSLHGARKGLLASAVFFIFPYFRNVLVATAQNYDV